jgi:hypothetical protein
MRAALRAAGAPPAEVMRAVNAHVAAAGWLAPRP